MKNILKEAKRLEEKYVEVRRKLHQNAEVGFDLPRTKALVVDTLTALGYAPKVCAGGIIATLGEEKKGKAILLRADMDGLPTREKTGKPYACKTGNMHACGHDMHTAMLLMAAELLKAREGELLSPVVFLFQAAEETLRGAKRVVEEGVLQTYNVGRAVMIHVLTATPIPTGKIVVASEGISAPAADFFTIEVQGKACHGSAPQNGVDALAIAARILLGLETLSARELPAVEPFVLTVGKMQAGVAENALPDRAVMQGTLRAMDGAVRLQAKKRLQEIAKGVAKTYRGRAKITFTSGCPALQNDGGTSALMGETLKNAVGRDEVFFSKELDGGVKRGLGGSEDFAYIAREVPSVMIAIAAGGASEGYTYPLHHPKATFAEEAIATGGSVYALAALAK